MVSTIPKQLLRSCVCMVSHTTPDSGHNIAERKALALLTNFIRFKKGLKIPVHSRNSK
jgi:hypothetical protein